MGQLWSLAVGGQEKLSTTPIAAAIRDNNAPELCRLLEDGFTEEDEPPLCLAARLGHNDCVLEILNASNKDLNLNQEDRSGFSPLVSAVYGGHTDVVVSLIKGFVKEKPTHVPD